MSRFRPTQKVLLGIMIYAILLRFPLLWSTFFLDYDDGNLIVNHPIVGHPSLQNLATVLTSNVHAKGQSGMHLANFISIAVFGPVFFWFMLSNLLYLCFHVYAAYRFSGVFLRDTRFQLGVTLLYASHNLLTDTAAWMAARGHFLGLPFAMMAFVFWDARVDQKHREFWRSTALAILCGMAATYSKLFFMTVFPLLGWMDLNRRYISRSAALSWGALLLPFAFFATWEPIYGGFFANIDRPKHPTLFGRIETLGEHFYSTLMPRYTSVIVQHTLPSDWWDGNSYGLAVGYIPPVILVGFFASLCCLGLYLRLVHKRWEVLYLLTAMVIILLPSLTWRPLEPGIAFEFRYAILPALCALTAIGVVFQVIDGLAPMLSKAMVAVTVLFAGAHSLFTVQQSLLLIDHDTYWQRCVDRLPGNFVCQSKAATIAHKHHDVSTQIADLNLQVEQLTQFGLLARSRAHLELANIYRKQKQPQLELENLRLALIRDTLRQPQRKSIQGRLRNLEAVRKPKKP